MVNNWKRLHRRDFYAILSSAWVRSAYGTRKELVFMCDTNKEENKCFAIATNENINENRFYFVIYESSPLPHSLPLGNFDCIVYLIQAPLPRRSHSVYTKQLHNYRRRDKNFSKEFSVAFRQTAKKKRKEK